MPTPTSAHTRRMPISAVLLRTGVRGITVLASALTGVLVVTLVIRAEYPDTLPVLTEAPAVEIWLGVAAFATTLALALTTASIATALVAHDERVLSRYTPSTAHPSEIQK